MPVTEFYWRLYFLYRYTVQPGENPAAARFKDVERKFRMTEIGFSEEPSYQVALCMVQVVRRHKEWRFFEEMYVEGGTWEQPVIWKRAVMCADAAKRLAEDEIRAEQDSSAPKVPPIVHPQGGRLLTAEDDGLTRILRSA